mmetsp:Transcript_131547/g.232446  ORF Transcript_131547/g.232446 Transcript_131547/m.232446 type:complete len:225 (+) Transcript_131547:70-744(+)
MAENGDELQAEDADAPEDRENEDDNSEEAQQKRERKQRDEEKAERMAFERHLRKAAADGRTEVVQRLLNAKVSPSGANSSGTTPLHEAAFQGNYNVCQVLLEYGADVCELDKWGGTALHHAASQGRKEIVKMFINRRADVNAMNHGRDMPLDVAKKNGHHRIAELLAEEAFQRYEQRKAETRQSCLKWSTVSTICTTVLVIGLYIAGYVGQDPFWLAESHANSL